MAKESSTIYRKIPFNCTKCDLIEEELIKNLKSKEFFMIIYVSNI